MFAPVHHHRPCEWGFNILQQTTKVIESLQCFSDRFISGSITRKVTVRNPWRTKWTKPTNKPWTPPEIGISTKLHNPTLCKTTKTSRKLKKIYIYRKRNWSKKMPEEEHEKKLTQKHYTTVWIKTSSQDSKVYLVSLQPSMDKLVVRLVVQVHHFPVLDGLVLGPLASGASELHCSVEAFSIQSIVQA